MVSGYAGALTRTLFLGEVDPASQAIWEANVAAVNHGKSLFKPGVSCADFTKQMNAFLEERELLQYRSGGYGHSLGLLSQSYGREAGLELREDIDTVLEPGMVLSMGPMLTLGEDKPGAGGYREADVLVITEDGHETLTAYPYGPDFNVIAS